MVPILPYSHTNLPLYYLKIFRRLALPTCPTHFQEDIKIHLLFLDFWSKFPDKFKIP
jgi:hypothetical protein